MNKQGADIDFIENITGFSSEKVRDIIRKNDYITDVLTRMVDVFP